MYLGDKGLFKQKTMKATNQYNITEKISHRQNRIQNSFNDVVTNVDYTTTAVNETEELQSTFVRLLFHGGARSLADNSAFHFASLNVYNDYRRNYIDDLSSRESVGSGKQIVEKIDSQEDNSIKSIDFFSHGDMFALYLIKGASIYETISKESVESNNLNASLYLGSVTRFWRGSNLHEDSRKIDEINFKKCNNKCIIEIHGCLTAGNLYLHDNMCEELSELLYSNGKTEAIVIGHTERANPNIKGSITTNEEQDYRHGERKIFYNGRVIHTTKREGLITRNEIDDLL